MDIEISNLTMIELIIFSALLTFEKLRPARTHPPTRNWAIWWLIIQAFASVWLIVLSSLWVMSPPLWTPLNSQTFTLQITISYLIYSFVSYWYHRLRHESGLLWRYLHYMHHSPARMDTFVTFFRHPIEIIVDSIVLIIIGKILLGISFEVMLAILIVESSLELFHHSNIQIPHWIRPLGYVIQIPEQHLIHHQKGLHKWNYGTLTLWDSLFGTLRFNKHWSHTVGLSQWREVKRILLYRY